MLIFGGQRLGSMQSLNIVLVERWYVTKLLPPMFNLIYRPLHCKPFSHPLWGEKKQHNTEGTQGKICYSKKTYSTLKLHLAKLNF